MNTAAVGYGNDDDDKKFNSYSTAVRCYMKVSLWTSQLTFLFEQIMHSAHYR